MLKLNSIFAGRYTILERIGSGGMADVYKARDGATGRNVAIKVLKPALSTDAEFVARFRSEGQAAASLNNPNIISVYDVGNSGNCYFIVMELIDGITLKDYIRRKGMLTARETMAIAAQVSVGLRAAHARHIVHRDIKPQNIILSRDGKVKVTDFGIARAITDETKAENKTTMGSVHYIAPEQAKGQICDERSDIYSLGIVMYEMIAGQVPFDKETSIAVALAHMNETMTPPSELNTECPKALEQIIFRCTQKSRDRRYHNCTELLQDLKVAVSNPDFDFEKQEKQNILKSDTNVFAIGGAGASLHTEKEQKSQERSTMIVDRYFEDGNGGDSSTPRFSGALGRNGEADETTENREKTDRRLFDSDRSEDEKSVFDRVLFIAEIVIGALIICLIIYIVATLSGCTQKSQKAPSTTTASTRSIGESSTRESTTEEFVSLETVESEKFNPEVDTIVPNVTGISLQAAMSILEESDLEFKISSSVIYSDDYKLGVICRQSYEEGTIVKKGSTIVITLSAGTDKFEILESYTGGQLAIFKNDVSRFGDIYEITYVKQNSDTVRANYIISITPASGIVEAGAKITVVYSAGPEYVSCPDLHGCTRTEALRKLLNGALNMGTTTYVYSEEVEENYVISQQYEAGTRLKNGATVSVVVSKGVETCEVPDVIGKTYEEAEELLTEAGLEIKVIETYDEEKEEDTVLEQDLEPESTVKVGEVITITVNRGDIVLDNYVGAGAEEANDALLALGYRTEVQFEDTDDENLNMIIKSMSPEAGSTLERGKTVILVVYQYAMPSEGESTSEKQEESSSSSESSERESSSEESSSTSP